MSKSKKWGMDYSGYQESNKGLESAGQIIVVILALGVLFAVYTFFAKTEWEPTVKPPVLKTNIKSKALGSFGRTEEESQPDEEVG